LLSKLVDKAIEKKKVQFKKMRPENDKADKNSGGDVVEIEEESPDPINIEIEYDDEGKGNEYYNKKDENYEKSEIISNILYSDIPADEWQRELERVSAKLKLDFSSANIHTSEWRSHIENIKNNEQNFAKSIPDSRSILENLSGDIDRSLEKIRKKEAMISKNFTNIVK
jgi:estrogen-related receptor beta like 1